MSLAEKLARLRKQAGVADAPERGQVHFPAPHAPAATPPRTGSEPDPVPTALRSEPEPTDDTLTRDDLAHAVVRPRTPLPDELRRLLGIRVRAGVAPAPKPRRAPDRHLPGDEISPGLRYLEFRHDPPPLDSRIDASFARDFADVARDDLLCFDTETTGLAGGTGTRAFMIGVADCVDGQVRVRQLLTTTLSAEPAMLRTFAGWLHDRTVLVSYNGRSYDAPLLKTRYRLARLPCPIAPLRHLDLLHPTRRRYRGRWENCRLGTIERRVLQVLRDDDLPGSEAPRAFRDWLAGGDATDLRRVLAHNHTDVRSLLALLAHLAEA